MYLPSLGCTCRSVKFRASTLIRPYPLPPLVLAASGPRAGLMAAPDWVS